MKRILLCLICIFSLLGSKAQSYNELVEKAMDYTFKDSLQQAEELFREALRLDPYNARNALLFSNLGTVLKRQGKIDEAIDSYTPGNMARYTLPADLSMIKSNPSASESIGWPCPTVSSRWY